METEQNLLFVSNKHKFKSHLETMKIV